MNRLTQARLASLVLIGGLSMPASLAAVAGLALPAVAVAQQQQGEAQTNLPIRGITLYRSGVGYFERRGMVEGSERIQLRFATEQINDILKSMVILDRGGGRIDGVSYGSKEPLERRLSSFGVDISDSPDVGKLLSRLRGAPVRIVTADGPIAGTVLSVEMRPTAIGKDDVPVFTPFVNLVTESGIRSVDLSRIASFEILDKDLAAELGKALAAIAEQRAERVKTVELSFSGQGAREAIVAYVHEMPVWKTSYRLVLPDAPERRQGNDRRGEPAPEGQPMLQGWAIVENTTDEDWEDVRLSLVAGRPVSFQMDLYEPLFMQRPQIPVPMIAGVMPRIYQAGAAFASREELRRRATAPAASAEGAAILGDIPRIDLKAAGRASQQGGDRGFREAELSGEELFRYSAQAQAQAGEIGEVFQYQLQAPVSIARQRSAMLPILSANTDGRRVSIYNRGDHAEHPMRGVEITNTTGLQLMPGPISVFDGAAYAGDAQIGHVTTGDKRLLAYAVDLDVQAVTDETSRGDVQSIRIVNGMLHQISKQERSLSYAFKNKDQKRPRLILIEHPKMEGWDLVEPKEPSDQTQAVYRFELPLEPAAAGNLRVVQERTQVERIAVTNYDWGTLLAYSRQGKVSKAVMDAVRQAADMQAAINDTQRRMEELERERAAIDQDQTRIRQNMGSIDRQTELYRRYTTKFAEQENRLEEIARLREKEQMALQKQREELNQFLRGLNVE